MSFTFLHAADLHLGSPFTGLALRDETLAQRFATASRDAFSNLVSRAIEEHVSFVVIAGDIYDGEWKDTSIGLFFNREIARLDRAGIQVFVLKGNHDAESVVTRAISLPGNVFQFPTKPKTVRIEELEVALHGRSFSDRAMTENIVLDYPDPVPGSAPIHSYTANHKQNVADPRKHGLKLRTYGEAVNVRFNRHVSLQIEFQYTAARFKSSSEPKVARSGTIKSHETAGSKGAFMDVAYGLKSLRRYRN